jgi:hypothetical protein
MIPRGTLHSTKEAIMIRRYLLAIITGTAFLGVVILPLASPSFAALKQQTFKAKLNGGQEVPYALTSGSGKFTGKLNKNETELNYKLSYSQLEGEMIQATIEFAQKGVNGAILVWFCDNTGFGPAGTPPCPLTPDGKIEGTFMADDVVGLAAQGIDPNDFNGFIKALRAGAGYVNVYTNPFLRGEVRGQIGKSFLGFIFNK